MKERGKEEGKKEGKGGGMRGNHNYNESIIRVTADQERETIARWTMAMAMGVITDRCRIQKEKRKRKERKKRVDVNNKVRRIPKRKEIYEPKQSIHANNTI